MKIRAFDLDDDFDVIKYKDESWIILCPGHL